MKDNRDNIIPPPVLDMNPTITLMDEIINLLKQVRFTYSNYEDGTISKDIHYEADRLIKKYEDNEKIDKDVTHTFIHNGDQQFIMDKDNMKMRCKCGHVAVYWKTGYICGTITAYPCIYSQDKVF